MRPVVRVATAHCKPLWCMAMSNALSVNPISLNVVQESNASRRRAQLLFQQKTAKDKNDKKGKAKMKKGYILSIYRNSPEADKLAAYAPAAQAALQGAGGRFIARGTPVKTFENGLVERSVVIEFDSVEAAIAAFESPEYKAALALLGDVDRDVRVIEGA